VKPSQKPLQGGFFFMREIYLSPAFLSLNKNAMKALFAVLDGRDMKNVSPKGKKKKFRCMNPDNMRLPYGLLEKTYRIPRGRMSADKKIYGNLKEFGQERRGRDRGAPSRSLARP
jgi:hypothetical protein